MIGNAKYPDAALRAVVGDDGSDRNLFVQELLKEIRVPDLMTEETLNRTRVGVTRASRTEQVTWISSSLTVGYGKTKLKDPSQPMSEVNRRVQVVNMQNKETVSK